VKLFVYVESWQVVGDHLNDGQSLLCCIKMVLRPCRGQQQPSSQERQRDYTLRTNLMGAHNGHAIPDEACTAISIDPEMLFIQEV
jgi:hypothetical protein